MEELSQLHDFINLILVFVITFVGLVMIIIVLSKNINQNLLEIQIVEWVWTIIPAVMLLQIALPSLLLLYMLDEAARRALTLKTVGHQWYWSYEYDDFWSLGEALGDKVAFDSYLLPTNELTDQIFRLLDVDNRTVVPLGTQIRMLVTSSDVLHCWAVPALGVKADATPGRLNQVQFTGQRPGLFFGQCSEICGANHRFMPIVVECVGVNEFALWLSRVWI